MAAGVQALCLMSFHDHLETQTDPETRLFGSTSLQVAQHTQNCPSTASLGSRRSVVSDASRHANRDDASRVRILGHERRMPLQDERGITTVCDGARSSSMHLGRSR